jgi:penicillin-binding protein 2
VFKIIVALAALQEEILSPSRVFVCMGEEVIYNHPFRCWKSEGHGMVNIYEAIRNSCNVFFYNLGKRMDINVIAKYARLHGLGTLSGIDLPAENKGLVPTREWKKNNLNEDWYPGETISIAIGQGMLNATPAELLVMISTVALRGQVPQLHLLKRIEKGGKPIREFVPKFNATFIDKKDYEIVIEGLYRVVNESGTGYRAKVEGVNVCGKTGTAQVITKNNPRYKQLVKQKRFTPHSWFVSFAPRNDPQIGMVVFIENGGDAGRVAAGLAGKIYKKIFGK